MGTLHEGEMPIARRQVLRGLDPEGIRTIYFALCEYRNQLLEDLATCYGGHEKYETADDAFLASMLDEVCDLILQLETAGMVPVAARPTYVRSSGGERKR